MVDRSNRPSALKATDAAGPEAQVDIVGSGSSQKVTATLPSGESVEVLLFGATITSWKSNGGKTENLWLSEKAALDGSKAVRGGVPVVFPVSRPLIPQKGVVPADTAIQGLRSPAQVWPPHLVAPTTRLRANITMGVSGQVRLRRCCRLQFGQARLRAGQLRAYRRSEKGMAVGLCAGLQCDAVQRQLADGHQRAQRRRADF